MLLSGMLSSRSGACAAPDAAPDLLRMRCNAPGGAVGRTLTTLIIGVVIGIILIIWLAVACLRLVF